MLRDRHGLIDYGEGGAGPTIVFVPGSWATGSAWHGVIAALGGRFRTVTTSLPAMVAREIGGRAPMHRSTGRRRSSKP